MLSGETANSSGCPWTLALGRHKNAIPPEIRRHIARLSTADNWHSLVSIATDWLVVAAAVAATLAAGMNPWVYALAVVAIGSRQRALRSLIHEASHGKLFGSARLNDALGRLLVAFPLMTSMTAYRCAHCQHHGHLWDPERDPKMARYAEQGLIAPPDGSLASFLRRHVARPLLLAEMPFNIWAALSWKGAPLAETLGRYAYWAVAIAAIAWLGWLDEFVAFWLVPFCTTYQVFRYWSDMADHAGLYSDNPWRSSRSWEGWALTVQLLGPHAANYHFPHHLFPNVPHYRVRHVHRLLLQVPEYAGGHHCDGFFWPRRLSAPSVLQDVRRGEQTQTGQVPVISKARAAMSVH